MKELSLEEAPILKMHYPTPEDITKSTFFQNAQENYALIIGLSDYEGVKEDNESYKDGFPDLPHALNDACAVRQFLLDSKVKFRDENITMLLFTNLKAIKK